MDEIVRCVKALQLSYQKSIATPANWCDISRLNLGRCQLSLGYLSHGLLLRRPNNHADIPLGGGRTTSFKGRPDHRLHDPRLHESEADRASPPQALSSCSRPCRTRRRRHTTRATTPATSPPRRRRLPSPSQTPPGRATRTTRPSSPPGVPPPRHRGAGQGRANQLGKAAPNRPRGLRAPPGTNPGRGSRGISARAEMPRSFSDTCREGCKSTILAVVEEPRSSGSAGLHRRGRGDVRIFLCTVHRDPCTRAPPHACHHT